MAMETYHPIPEEFWPAVDEVVRFVREGQLLSRAFQPERFHDFPCEVVYEVADWTPYQVTGLPDSKCETEWIEIRVSSEGQHSRLRKLSVERYPAIRSTDFNEKLNEIYLALRPIVASQSRANLPNITPSDISEINVHINLVIETRAKLGAGHSQLIDEKLFNVYKAFGYPCGWIGPFPGGKLLVFSNDKSRAKQ